MRKRLAPVLLVLVLLVAAMILGSVVLVETITNTTESTGQCAPSPGVERTELSSQRFGEVTTYQLPEPLRAPNSIASAPDGSVWFGEVALRGVAHLFENGTLLEYPWPSSAFNPGMSCYDLSELWGLVVWKDMVWASDSANNQLVGLDPSNDTFHTVQLRDDSIPRFLAVDKLGNLWFTESSQPAQIGEINATTGALRYFDVPAAQHDELSASILFYNSSLAYTVTVNPDNNYGQVFSFDPLAPGSTFRQAGGNMTLLAPYSVAVADGGLWVSEHDASDLEFYNQTSGAWVAYPTSVNPEVLLTLPYYVVANGSSIWFNEHDSDKIGEICCDNNSGAASLTEYNISSVSLAKVGIGNALTIAVDKNLVWFTEWTGNEVGYVNSSLSPGFSVSVLGANGTGAPAETARPGSSTQFRIRVTGGNGSSPLDLGFADSESHTAIPQNITFTTNVSSDSNIDPSRAGQETIDVSVSVGSQATPGRYLLLVTVSDGSTDRSVYLSLVVT